MKVNGSCAVWSELLNEAVPCDGEVHFNYWRLSRPRNRLLAWVISCFVTPKRDFVEVGVWLDNPAAVSKVVIYLPGHEWSLEDVGLKFNNPNIAQGIFNEQLTSRRAGDPQPPCVELQKPDESIFCRVHLFSEDGKTLPINQLSVAKVGGGKSITITRPALDQIANIGRNAPAYFRLRAYWHGAAAGNPFVTEERPHDRAFQSSFSVLEFIDFRLNESRTLPREIAQPLTKPGLVKCRLIAFLTAVPIQSDIVMSSSDPNKKRMLERDLWTEYVNGLPKGMVVYHWRRPPKGNGDVAPAADGALKDFTAIVKIHKRHTGVAALLLYLFLAFLIAIAGNLVASGIWERWNVKPEVAQPVQPTNNLTISEPTTTKGLKK
ncbi:MAG: hypothetical protein AB7O46_05960 [Xanthobacteraceae bacterium]